jgi:Apg6 BARA domain
MSSPLQEYISSYLGKLRTTISELESFTSMKEEQRNTCINRVNELERERGKFKFLQAIKTDASNEQKVQHADELYTQGELDKLTKDEEELTQDLEDLLLEEKEGQEEMLRLFQDRKKLEGQEVEFWNKANSIEIGNIVPEEESVYTRHQIQFYNSEWERLSGIFMLNEVFEIQIINGMGTISKLHLGKNMETGSINWDETNAAFGHILLLLNYLCVRNDLKVPNIEFDLLGSLSSIRLSTRDGPAKDCRLAGPPQNDNNEKSFNIGLVKLSYCVDYIATELKNKILRLKSSTTEGSGADQDEDQRHLKKQVRATVDRLELSEDKLVLPFPINDGKIGTGEKNDIRYSRNHLVEWTTALRFLMIDIKFVIRMQSVLEGYEVSKREFGNDGKPNQ